MYGQHHNGGPHFKTLIYSRKCGVQGDIGALLSECCMVMFEGEDVSVSRKEQLTKRWRPLC